MANINYIASAGTGKTTKLVYELLEKISTERVSLKNILVLTFTEKTANELKERIALELEKSFKDNKLEEDKKKFIYKQLIYIDSGYIGTFHSVFRKFLIKYSLFSKIDKSYNILSNEELNTFLTICFERWIEEDFQNDKEGWSILLDTFSERSLKKTFFEIYKKREKLFPDLKLENTKIFKKIFDFIKFVENQKQIEKVYDFNDILEKTLKLVKTYPDIKNNIKNNFKYIFIDEFQDTDSIQVEIIKEISNNNIYVFGDPKQCIYAWRNANLDIYLTFLKENNFEDVIMDTNYRSCKKIVDFSNILLKNPTFLSHIDKNFKKPVKPSKSEDGKVELLILKTNKKDKKEIIKEEAKLTVKIIKDLINENIQYNDILILFRDNNSIKIFSEVFSEYSIPYTASTEINLFETKEVKTVLDILKFIEYPDRKLELLKVLKSPLFNLSNEEIYKIKDDFSIESIQTENAKVLERLAKQKYDLTLEEIIDTIYSETDILESFSLFYYDTKFLEILKNLKLLIKEKTLENLSLRDFIIFSETSYIPVKNSLENSVNLLTIHKAKGLESKVVIIPLLSMELNNNNFRELIDIKDNQIYINIDDLKIGDIDKYQKNTKDSQKKELERLFYVAVTRPKERLVLIKSENNRIQKYNLENIRFSDYIKNLELNDFFEIKEFNQIDIKKTNITDLQSLENIKKQYENLENLELERENIFNQALKDTRFKSVSQILEEDREVFTFTKEDPENLSLQVGTFIHNVLEYIDFKDFTVENMEKNIKHLENTIPENVREKVVEYSLKFLKKLVHKEFANYMKNVKILFKELPFILYEEGTFIEGRIDVIYEKDGKIFVMDYKTNRYETEDEKQKILRIYEKQKEYYLKAVKKIYPDRKLEFKLALLYKGEIV